MVKVSIILPNTAQITFESEEPEVIHEVVGLVLRDLPRDLMGFTPPVDGGTSQPASVEKGIGVTGTPFPPRSSVGGAPATPDGPERARRRSPAANARTTAAQPHPQRPEESATQSHPEDPQRARSPEAEAAFVEFCHSANPMKGMRRVVVAAEAASRFFDLASVDAADLAWLFDLVDWRLPHDFTQTLRNAGRGKFRWLERVPGRSGRYSATGLGRAVTLGE